MIVVVINIIVRIQVALLNIIILSSELDLFLRDKEGIEYREFFF